MSSERPISDDGGGGIAGADHCPCCLRYDGYAAARLRGDRFCPQCGVDWRDLEVPLGDLDEDSVVLAVPDQQPALTPLPAAPPPIEAAPRDLALTAVPEPALPTPLPPSVLQVEPQPAEPERPRPPYRTPVVLAFLLLFVFSGAALLVQPKPVAVEPPAAVPSAAAPVVASPPPVAEPLPAARAPEVAAVPEVPDPASVPAVTQAVARAVEALPPGARADVQVDVEGAIAFLRGTVDTRETLVALTDAAGSRPGIRAVDTRGVSIAPTARRHVVARGETLSGLARRYLGEREAWRAIWEANPGIDPHTIRVGQALVLPALEPGAPEGPGVTRR